MTRSLNGHLALALLGLLLASTAHADVVDDVWRGTNIRLNAARIHVRGNDYAAGYWLLPKAAYTLDLNVPARDFGIDSDLVLRLHGSRSGSVITWTFDDTLPRPYYLGSANNVTRVRGTLRARAQQVRGADDPYCNNAPCPHNVELVLESGTRVWVDGYTDVVFHFSWTEEVQVRQFVAYAGVPRPSLASVRVTVPTFRCPSQAPSELSGEVTLSSPAPTGGILVDLMSVDASVGVLPVRVPEAQSFARFALRLPGGWSGPTVIYAASGGVRQSVRVSLNKCITALPAFTRWYFLAKHVLPRWVLRGGSVVASLEGSETDVLVTPDSEVLKLEEVLGASRVRVQGVQPTGDLFGTAYTEKGPSAFRLRAEKLEVRAELRLDGWEAVAANAHGTLLVRPAQDEGNIFRVDEVGPAKHPGLAELYPSRVLFNTRGQVAATVKTEEGSRALRIYGQDVKMLLDVESAVTALNDLGVFAGVAHSQDKGGLKPFRWSEEEGLQWLPLLEGHESARVTAINDGGWVLGTATAEEGKKRTAFITTPDGKTSLPLDTLLPEELAKEGLRIEEALSLSDDFQVLVRAVDGQGQPVHLVLSP
jgi:hypothetical protein